MENGPRMRRREPDVSVKTSPRKHYPYISVLNSSKRRTGRSVASCFLATPHLTTSHCARVFKLDQTLTLINLNPIPIPIPNPCGFFVELTVL